MWNPVKIYFMLNFILPFYADPTSTSSKWSNVIF